MKTYAGFKRSLGVWNFENPDFIYSFPPAHPASIAWQFGRTRRFLEACNKFPCNFQRKPCSIV